MIYRFEPFEIDTQNYQLRRAGETLAIEPKVYDLLTYLVTNRDKVVTRDELFENIWPGQVVSDTSLSNQVKAARKAIDDDGQAQSSIKTVHGRGYRFVAGITEVDDQTVTPAQPSTEEICDVRNTGPVIAVLPFQNLSSDPEQDFFCEGISEDITTELARFSDIQVIARHSAFQFDGGAYDIGELAGQLGADYVVEGSVRRAGKQVRINVQLIETSSRNHAWAERYDFPLEKIFAVQDDIIETVVSTMTGQIRKIEMDRARSRCTNNLSAYEHLLRGLSYHKSFWPSHEDYVKAHAEFNQAIDLDPGLARARAWRVCSHGGVKEYITREDFTDAIEYTMETLALDDKEAEAHRVLAVCYMALGEHRLGRHHIERARVLCPNDAHIIARSAMIYLYLGELDMAQASIDRAMQLNPLHPGWYWLYPGLIRYFREDYRSAIEYIRRNTDMSGYDWAWIAACYIALGDTKQAEKAAAKALEIDSTASVRKFTEWDSYRESTGLEQIRERMAAAGIPA